LVGVVKIKCKCGGNRGLENFG